MKKLFLIALSGIALFAFSACGSKGSQEFKDSKKLIENVKKAANSAKTCEELQEAGLSLLAGALTSASYSDGEKMTDAEKKKIEDLTKELNETFEKISKKLDCSGFSLF